MKPRDVFHSFGDRVNTFVSGGMTGSSMADTVEHKQSFFGNRRMHRGWFAHDTERDRRQLGQDTVNPSLPGHLFFGRRQKNQIIGLVLHR